MNTKFSFCFILTTVFSISISPAISAPLNGNFPAMGSTRAEPRLTAPTSEVSPSSAAVAESVSYKEDSDSGILTTVDQDGTEYVIDTKTHVAFIRKAGVIVDSMKCDGTTATCLDDVLSVSGSDLESMQSKW